MKLKESFLWVSIIATFLILFFILVPVLNLLTSSSFKTIKITITQKEVIKALWLSIYTSGFAGLISLLFGTPFAYLLARKNFFGKRFIESIVDIPIVIPHPVVGIAILGVVGKNHIIGKVLYTLGIRIMGSVTGIITVLVFVGIPFYINACRNAFENISPRIENVSRSLGASLWETLLYITFPLASRGMLVGFIMCMARAISEFGAVVVLAYHPMIAPVLIYDKFETSGLNSSQPIAVLLILICLVLFLGLRTIPHKK